MSAARAVSFWEVHQYVDRALAGAGEFPMAGTPDWCSLADDDPRKLAAVLDAGQHHALRIEMAQEAQAEASKAIAASADWKRIADELRQLREFQAAHPWARRVVS